jgi:hypothetical protein
MLYRKPITIVVGAAFAAYNAGEHFRYYEPSAPLVVATASSTSSVSISGVALIYSPTTFAEIELPPAVPTKQKFEQG